ncbi:PTS galactitol transporter subunit IIC [Clostridium tyrobutyricum]|uniref:PTS galactitol transporter subunit IIC n=1 Tax=Clostridium tyrobutyricum TaxID=1519 RepID=UPI001C38C153|nr:PTS transporter subunit IIC [Clostridium tyrobutyricum]MBV4439425.1 PTS galactitol transporter subunit IIC [Clostridium tyrobutyricum]
MFFEALKRVFDSFGAYIFVPIMLYIIARVMKCNRKRAFQSALFAGVGLEGFSLLINSFIPIITPLVRSMVSSTGIHLPAIDMGWQTISIVAYSTNVGMIYLGLCILLQVILFLVKWTDVFQAADLWNNYSYMVWGSIIYLLTKNMFLALGCMIILTLYTLLCTELTQKRWSTYYHYPRCTISALHTIGAAPFAIVLDILLDKLHLNKIKADPQTIQKKLGFLGDPTTLGFLLGMLLGVIGNIKRLNTLGAWGNIALIGVATAAVMTIFPKIASVFASAFTIITDASKKATKGKKDTRVWYIAINDAAGYGETATLISGLLLIPILLIISFILPGNRVLPMVDLIAIPYGIQAMVCVSNGNIVKTIISGAIWFTLGLLLASFTAPVFTEVAKQVGVSIPSTGLFITSLLILAQPLAGVIFLAFLSQNPVLIGLVVVAYLLGYVIFRKNKVKLQDFLEERVKKNKELIQNNV